MPKRIILPCDELRRLYEYDGLTTVLLGQRYGCSTTTIANRLRRCGALLRDARFQPHAISLAELLRLYQDEHYSVGHIAQHFGVSVSTIYNRLNAAGISKRRRLVRERRTVGYRLRRIRNEVANAYD